MKTYGGVDVQTEVFLTSALMDVRGQLHAQAASSMDKEPLVPIV
jgi:hypothetical protein